MAEGDRQALKDYLGKGGFLWAEASAGSVAFDQAFRKLAGEAGWELKPIGKSHTLMTGKFKAALGYDLTTGVQFRRKLRTARADGAFADLTGIYQDGNLVGLYSPFDVVFSTTGYEAYGCRGYQPEDALAVAANIVAYLADR